MQAYELLSTLDTNNNHSFLKLVESLTRFFMDLTCPHLSTPEERFLAVLGVIGIVLNLLLLVFVYIYTST